MTETASDTHRRLQALLDAGAPERTPVRWHHLHTLQTRMAGLPPAVAVHLAHALERAVTACEQDLERARATPPVAAPALARHAALSELNAHLRRQHDHTAHDAALAGEAIDPTELASLRRFRASWSRIAAEEQVAQAITRTPDNAGPLNSHALVLRSLALMRELSPDYLQRFLAQLDTLMWLEDVGQRTVTPRPARKPRAAR